MEEFMNPENYENIILPDYEHCILGTISSILKIELKDYF